MGYLSIPLQALFQTLGVELLLPPPTTEKTLNIGHRLAPESACLPLKIQLGSFVEALNRGAQTLIMLGGGGPCRLGLFAVMEELILQEEGYDFSMVVLEPSFPRLYRAVQEIAPSISLSSLLKGLWWGYRKLLVVEYVIKRLNQAWPYLKGIPSLKDSYMKRLDAASTVGALERIVQEAGDLPRSFGDPKVGIIGDIYTILDPFANMDLEERLGKLGVVPHPSITISGWIKEHLFLRPLGLFLHRPLEAAAQPYLKYPVGGLGLEGIGRSVLYAREGYLGVIQVFPFGCMPEVVAEEILMKVSRDLDFPILQIIFDDSRSPVGLETRLEAFVELLKRKGGDGIGEAILSGGGSRGNQDHDGPGPEDWRDPGPEATSHRGPERAGACARADTQEY